MQTEIPEKYKGDVVKWFRDEHRQIKKSKATFLKKVKKLIENLKLKQPS